MVKIQTKIQTLPLNLFLKTKPLEEFVIFREKVNGNFDKTILSINSLERMIEKSDKKFDQFMIESKEERKNFNTVNDEYQKNLYDLKLLTSRVLIGTTFLVGLLVIVIVIDLSLKYF